MSLTYVSVVATQHEGHMINNFMIPAGSGGFPLKVIIHLAYVRLNLGFLTIFNLACLSPYSIQQLGGPTGMLNLSSTKS